MALSQSFRSPSISHSSHLIFNLDGDEIKVKEFNPQDLQPIKEFIKKVGDKFVKADYSGTLFNYFNKKMLPDLKVEDKALIYKDKYRFTEDNMDQELRANLDNLK